MPPWSFSSFWAYGFADRPAAYPTLSVRTTESSRANQEGTTVLICLARDGVCRFFVNQHAAHTWSDAAGNHLLARSVLCVYVTQPPLQ